MVGVPEQEDVEGWLRVTDPRGERHVVRALRDHHWAEGKVIPAQRSMILLLPWASHSILHLPPYLCPHSPHKE